MSSLAASQVHGIGGFLVCFLIYFASTKSGRQWLWIWYSTLTWSWPVFSEIYEYITVWLCSYTCHAWFPLVSVLWSTSTDWKVAFSHFCYCGCLCVCIYFCECEQSDSKIGEKISTVLLQQLQGVHLCFTILLQCLCHCVPRSICKFLPLFYCYFYLMGKVVWFH